MLKENDSLVQVKICGLTSMDDVHIIEKYGADYAGMVLYYPKSKRNIDINLAAVLVAPGIVKTERFSELYEESGEKIDTRIQKIALGRLGAPEDVANACAFLASERSSYISGQILGVDGCASI